MHNVDTEQNLIGAILVLKGYGESVEEVMTTVKPDDFYFTANRNIFSAMLDIQHKGLTIDINSVCEHQYCQENYSYIMDIFKNTASGANILAWCKAIKDLSELRAIQDQVNNINEIISTQIDTEEKLKQIDNLFSVEIGVTNNKTGAVHISECMDKYVDHLEQRWTNPDSIIFSTGIPDLDKIYDGGFEIGLHIVAARPKMGKTELAVKIINHTAKHRGLPVYVASLEMKDTKIVERSVSSYGRISKTSIKNNFENETNQEMAFGAFAKSCQELKNTDLYIHDEVNSNVRKIKRECRRIKKRHGSMGLVMVDYLGLLDHGNDESRHDLNVAKTTKALTELSKEMECPVLLLSQLNRSLESRIDKRPKPSDLKDSGAIEADASSIIFLYRDSVYNHDSDWKMITEVIVSVNRDGGTGTCYQDLTSFGFIDVPIDEVALIQNKEDAKAVNQAFRKQKNTGDF